jgi:hypothetical protein
MGARRGFGCNYGDTPALLSLHPPAAHTCAVYGDTCRREPASERLLDLRLEPSGEPASLINGKDGREVVNSRNSYFR